MERQGRSRLLCWLRGWALPPPEEQLFPDPAMLSVAGLLVTMTLRSQKDRPWRGLIFTADSTRLCTNSRGTAFIQTKGCPFPIKGYV